MLRAVSLGEELHVCTAQWLLIRGPGLEGSLTPLPQFEVVVHDERRGGACDGRAPTSTVSPLGGLPRCQDRTDMSLACLGSCP